MSSKTSVHFVDKILKFGGSSVGSPDSLKKVLGTIIKSYADTPKMGVVVSAFAGVTDQLVAIGKLAVGTKGAYQEGLNDLLDRHIVCIKELIDHEHQHHVLEIVLHEFSELQHILDGVFLIKEISAKTLDHIMSFGERLSAFIIAEALKQSISQAFFLDAREVIKTDRSFGSAQVDFEETNSHIQKHFEKSTMPIISGFIGSSKEKETTTLGRGGSDYSAAIFGAALNAKIIEIWTDVDGVMTADPRKEPYAFPIPKMSYKEAMEMSHFGAKVIHSPTITPALEKNIPLLIKNTFHPEALGTLVSIEPSHHQSLICGISSIDNVALFCLQGSGMVGVCGIARRLFGVLAEKGISVILISQGSSEHSICFAILPSYIGRAKEAIQKEFLLEMRAHVIDELIVQEDLSVVAVVGENMCQTPGISGKLFSSLARNAINVIAIAQGSSELNISIVIKKEDEVKAIRAIHESFFLSPRKTLHLFLVGLGLIGSTLLHLIEKYKNDLLEKHSLDVRVIGIVNSSAMVFDSRGIDVSNWQNTLVQSKMKNASIDGFVNLMFKFNLINTVFIDCTASQGVTDVYAKVLNANVSIVTPNKKANSGLYKNYKILREITSQKGISFLYGSNVGAGLPIISTLHEMIRSGDRISKIEAILSGTISFLFNSLTEGKKFSELLKEAQNKGYAEPDPREDLNGMDMARKLLILARECGRHLEMEDIIVDRFLPDAVFKSASIAEFYSELQKYDESLSEQQQNAQRQGKVLRYIAGFDGRNGRISLKSFGIDHPFYHLKGSENIIVINSEFYAENPLVIKGPGAGAEVTAGKVFADIVQIGLSDG